MERTKPQEIGEKQQLPASGVRQYTFEICIGTSGSGKTFKTKQIIEEYLRLLNLPVIIFDINGEYTKYKMLDFDVSEENDAKRGEVIRLLCKKSTKPFIARIVPIRKDGSKMTTDEMQLTYKTIAQNFFGGMIVFDDILTYERGFRDKQALGIANTLRHGKDLILGFQSIAHIQDVLWGVVKHIRMHKLSVNPITIAKRIPNIIPIEVAYILIEEYYKEGYAYITQTLGTSLDSYAQDLKENPKKYSPSQKKEANKIYQRYSIRINPAKIRNITKEDFDKGLSIYFKKYEPREISRTQNYLKCSYEQALQQLINDNQHYRE